ncbi:hypothetical protein HYV74_02840 [Candidatus Uhrbacteria bacterium]|nr:hypothetical protein [Candidatus Uhrbacteria bacterium]
MVGVAALGMVLTSLARVRVVLVVRPEPVRVDVEIPLVTASTAADAGAIVGRVVRVDGTGSMELATELGGTPVPAGAAKTPAHAQGVVTLINTQSTSQALVARTRLLAPDGALFRLTRSVVIPARGRVERVPVIADRVGTGGNVGPAKWTIPGLSPWLQERIWAESAEPMTGGVGADTTAPGGASGAIVTEELLAAARRQAIAHARADARKRSEANAGDGEEIILLDEESRATSSADVGASVPAIRVDAVTTAVAFVVPRAQLQARVRAALEQRASALHRTLGDVDMRAMTVQLVRHDAASALVRVHGEAAALLESSAQSFVSNRIAGFTAAEVQTYVRSIPGVSDVEVSFWPFWVQRVPFRSANVTVEVQPVSSGAE